MASFNDLTFSDCAMSSRTLGLYVFYFNFYNAYKIFLISLKCLNDRFPFILPKSSSFPRRLCSTVAFDIFEMLLNQQSKPQNTKRTNQLKSLHSTKNGLHISHTHTHSKEERSTITCMDLLMSLFLTPKMIFAFFHAFPSVSFAMHCDPIYIWLTTLKWWMLKFFLEVWMTH